MASEFASEELQNNEAVVTAAAGQNGMALEFTTEELQNNKQVVLTAVAGNGHVLKFASNKRKGDFEIVRSTLQESPSAKKHLTQDFILAACTCKLTGI